MYWFEMLPTLSGRDVRQTRLRRAAYYSFFGLHDDSGPRLKICETHRGRSSAGSKWVARWILVC